MLYKYFTAKHSSITEVYAKPSAWKMARERSIMADMINDDGYYYKVIPHNQFNFVCGYMRGAGIRREVRMIYKTREERFCVPSLMPWIVQDGGGFVRLELRVSVVGYDDLIIPYNKLIPELKPMFSEALKVWEGHISNIY